MSKILITGASGLIGSVLTNMLLQKGHDVVHLGRSKNAGPVKTYQWDIAHHTIENGAFEGVDTIIHLAGAGIADKPWTDARKREILESRTHSTRLLYEVLKKGSHQVKNFISASAIGYYGFEDGEKELEETDTPGTDFLAIVVKKWEEEVDQISSLGLRVVKIRIGIVLSTEGGALKEIAKPVKFYLGAPLGTGKQNVSWIHIEDLGRLFVKAVEDQNFKGAYNGVGPYPVTNQTLTKAIAKTLSKPLLLPSVPAFALKMLFGEMADLVLNGNKVSAAKLKASGFTYKFNTLEEALHDLLLTK